MCSLAWEKLAGRGWNLGWAKEEGPLWDEPVGWMAVWTLYMAPAILEVVDHPAFECPSLAQTLASPSNISSWNPQLVSAIGLSLCSNMVWFFEFQIFAAINEPRPDVRPQFHWGFSYFRAFRVGFVLIWASLVGLDQLDVRKNRCSKLVFSSGIGRTRMTKNIWKTGWWFLFSITYGIKSQPHWRTPSFFKMVNKPPTS